MRNNNTTRNLKSIRVQPFEKYFWLAIYINNNSDLYYKVKFKQRSLGHDFFYETEQSQIRNPYLT